MGRYEEAHLFVAAIRVLTHQKKGPPALEEVCELLKMTDELGAVLSRDLQRRGIVQLLQDPFATRLMVANHNRIEDIPRGEEDKNLLAEQIEKFQQKKKEGSQKATEMYAAMEKLQEKKLADIEAKLREQMAKQKKKDR